MKSYLFKIIVGVVTLIPVSTYAAGTVSISVESSKVAPGQEFVVTVTLDSGGSTINAVSGSLSMNKGLVPRTVIEGNSIIPVWIEKPSFLIATSSNDIFFAGIIPGGLSGKGELFKFIVMASSTGSFVVQPKDIEILTASQNPTPLSVKKTSASILVQGEPVYSHVLLKDTASPQDMAASIETNENVYGGETFLVFSATDKQTGIARYDIGFSRIFRPDDTAWISAQSPYQLDGNASSKLVWVRAVDNAGNISYIHIAGPGYYRNIVLLGILIVIILCLAHFVRKYFASRR